MTYKTGQYFKVSSYNRHRRTRFEAIIKLGNKYPPKAGKSDRYRIITISGIWPYDSISINNLDKCGTKVGPAVEVLYANSN